MPKTCLWCIANFFRASRLSDLRQRAKDRLSTETEQQRLLQLRCVRTCSYDLYYRHDRLASVQQNTHQRLIQENEDQRWSFLATMSFPTLFLHAKGDPCNPGRPRSVSLSDSFKHLEKYGEISASNNLPSWHFATHPRFPYWALNMKQRHQLLSQAKVYPQHHPGDARLSMITRLSFIYPCLCATL